MEKTHFSSGDRVRIKDCTFNPRLIGKTGKVTIETSHLPTLAYWVQVEIGNFAEEHWFFPRELDYETPETRYFATFAALD